MISWGCTIGWMVAAGLGLAVGAAIAASMHRAGVAQVQALIAPSFPQCAGCGHSMVWHMRQGARCEQCGCQRFRPSAPAPTEQAIRPGRVQP